MEVTIAHMILIPLFFALAGIFFCWLYYVMRRPARHRVGTANIYRCQICYHVYLDQRDVPLSRCPRCGCLNEAVKR